MRVLVCGGRDYDDLFRVYEELDKLNLDRKTDVIICGGARGADELAIVYAEDFYIETKVYYALWNKHGRSAGPIRNQRMLDEGKPDLVVAFPGGVGTADMVARSRKAGIEVREIK